jgi:hypothetical protein
LIEIVDTSPSIAATITEASTAPTLLTAKKRIKAENRNRTR